MFKNDPYFGDVLNQYRTHEWTEDTIDYINSGMIDMEKEIVPPIDKEVFYACLTNRERNVISTSIFADHVNTTHPDFQRNIDHDTSICDDIPMHTVVIEGYMVHHQTNKDMGKDFHNNGDGDIKNGSHLIGPALKFYSGIPLMINTNKDLKKCKSGNGTLCRGVGIKLKPEKQLIWKNWDDKKVLTVSTKDLEYMVCEKWTDNRDSESPKETFKIEPETCHVAMKLKLFGNEIYGNANDIKGIKMTQFPVNSNIATTGHKLQGQTRKLLVVGEWNYRCKNWVYVVLSRVTSIKGLFLSEELSKDMEKYRISDELWKEEQRLIDMDIETRKRIKWDEELKSGFGFK